MCAAHIPSPTPTPSLVPPLGEGWVSKEVDASNDSPAVYLGLPLTLSALASPFFKRAAGMPDVLKPHEIQRFYCLYLLYRNHSSWHKCLA